MPIGSKFALLVKFQTLYGQESKLHRKSFLNIRIGHKSYTENTDWSKLSSKEIEAVQLAVEEKTLSLLA